MDVPGIKSDFHLYMYSTHVRVCEVGYSTGYYV